MSIQGFDPRKISLIAAVAVLAAALAGCVTPPPRQYEAPAPQPPQQPPIIVYPAHGQTAQQLDKDRYECHEWAVMQTGFDPSGPQLPPAGRVVVQQANAPGTHTAVGAIVGAVLGAAIAGPRDAGLGLVMGGITGAAIGSSGDAAEAAQARAAQQQANEAYAHNYQAFEIGANNYRRAMTACLVGRGYTVQ